MSPEDYAKLFRDTRAVIKSVNMQAMVCGPAVCGINLKWLDEFYRKDGGKHCDVFTVHDYEGNESVDPGHWAWKIGELRKLMRKNGEQDTPLWQTERGIPGIRGNTFLGGAQAVRVLLHRDVLETLGIPSEHNFYYYLNAGGYGGYPAYLWGAAGPHPGALGLRTRQAMIQGMNFQGVLNLGHSGNRLFMGLHFVGNQGQTMILRNLGSMDMSLEMDIDGGLSVQVSDAFGNTEALPVRDGRLKLMIGAMPTYLLLAIGQAARPVKIDFGRNMGPDAAISYSGTTKSDMSILNNGVLEVTHAGSPWGKHWVGDWPAGSSVYLDIAFAAPRRIDRVIVYSMRADNPHCALLDFDVQIEKGGQWHTINQVRTPCPISDPVRIPDSSANTWYMDQNFAVASFEPVLTQKLRIVPLRATQGFMPDVEATKYANWKPGGDSLHLREIEIYGPLPPIDLSASCAAMRPLPFEKEPIAIRLINRGQTRIEGTIKPVLPDGWMADPKDIKLGAGVSGIAHGEIKVTPPPEMKEGSVPLRFEMLDAKGQIIEYATALLNLTPPGPIRPWSLIGSFPNENNKGFDAVYEPERGVDLKKEIKLGDKTLKWKTAMTDGNGLMNLVPQFSLHDNVVAYAVIYAKVSTPRKAILSAGTDDGCKAWLNGKQVISDNYTGAANPGKYKVPVELQAGWNELLIKITQGGGDWGYYAEIVDEKEQPFKDLMYSAKKD